MQVGALLPSVPPVSGDMGITLPAPQPAATAGPPRDPAFGQADGQLGGLLPTQQMDAMPGLQHEQQVTALAFMVFMGMFLS